MSYLPPLVSVIVPVYNDPECLLLCLQALEQQNYPQDRYEVIVVDNGSDKADIKGVVAQFSQAIAEYEETPGSYAARNRGLKVAKGEAIAFTDADCIPAPDWIEKGIIHLQRVPNCGLVGGKIELFWRDRDCPSMVELYETVVAFPQKKFIEANRYSVTANVFTWKKVLEQVGNFNSGLKSSGDVDWGNRVYDGGYQQIYAEDVKVAHPALYSIKQLQTKTARHAGGTYDLKLNQPEYNWLQKNKLFLGEIAFNLMPPVFFAIDNFTNPELKSISDKLKVVLTLTLARYITILELIRLKLGGVSTRQ